MIRRSCLILFLTICSIYVINAQAITKSSLEIISSVAYDSRQTFVVGEWLTASSYAENGNYLTQGFIQLFPTNEQEIEHATWSIYPNPTSYSLSVSDLDNSSSSTGVILDQLGSVVITSPLHPSSNTINIESLVSGIYYLKILNKNHETRIVKFIKI